MGDEFCAVNSSLALQNDDDTVLDLSKYDYFRSTVFNDNFVTSDYVKMVAYLITIIGGLLGNISVILTVALNRSMRTTINIYVANLAVADMLVCLCCMLDHFVSIFSEPIYVLGAFMCKFNSFIQMATLTCSVLTMSAISCDRFMAIMFPLRHRITKQRTSLVIAIIWIISIIVSLPFLHVKRHVIILWLNFIETKCDERWPSVLQYVPRRKQCFKFYPLQVLYYCFVTVILFFLPVAIMVTAYSLILWRLWRSEVPGERHEANINVQYRAKKRVIKMVFVVLVAFIICWAPLQIIVLYSQFAHNAYLDGQLPSWFNEFTWFSYFIAYANSFLNPIIYGGFNKTFREGFCVVLRCGFRRQRFNRPLVSQRSRMTITTGVNSSSSRYTSKTINGAGSQSLKTNEYEMKKIPVTNDSDSSPNAKDTYVSIADDNVLT